MGAHLATYSALIALEGALALLVVRRTGPHWRDLLSDTPPTTSTLLRDVCIGAAMWAVWMAFSLFWQHVSPSRAGVVVSALLPTTAAERAAWILLSCSAGFAEELAFRGALQRWAERKTGNAVLAIVIQALIFGVVHGYQGMAAALRIVVYGAFFGVVARSRRSLIPGMLAHAWTDIAAGLLRV